MERKEKRDRENASVKRMFDIGFSVDLRKNRVLLIFDASEIVKKKKKRSDEYRFWIYDIELRIRMGFNISFKHFLF